MPVAGDWGARAVNTWCDRLQSLLLLLLLLWLLVLRKLRLLEVKRPFWKRPESLISQNVNVTFAGVPTLHRPPVRTPTGQNNIHINIVRIFVISQTISILKQGSYIGMHGVISLGGPTPILRTKENNILNQRLQAEMYFFATSHVRNTVAVSDVESASDNH